MFFHIHLERHNKTNHDSRVMWCACLLPVAPVHTPPSDGSIYMHMPHALKHMYCVSDIASSLAFKTVARSDRMTLVFLKQSQYTYEYILTAIV